MVAFHPSPSALLLESLVLPHFATTVPVGTYVAAEPHPIVQPGNDLAEMSGEQLRDVWLDRVRCVMGAGGNGGAARGQESKRRRTGDLPLVPTFSGGSNSSADGTNTF